MGHNSDLSPYYTRSASYRITLLYTPYLYTHPSYQPACIRAHALHTSILTKPCHISLPTAHSSFSQLVHTAPVAYLSHQKYTNLYRYSQYYTTVYMLRIWS